MTGLHLAELKVGILLAPTDGPRVAGTGCQGRWVALRALAIGAISGLALGAPATGSEVGADAEVFANCMIDVELAEQLARSCGKRFSDADPDHSGRLHRACADAAQSFAAVSGVADPIFQLSSLESSQRQSAEMVDLLVTFDELIEVRARAFGQPMVDRFRGTLSEPAASSAGRATQDAPWKEDDARLCALGREQREKGTAVGRLFAEYVQ